MPRTNVKVSEETWRQLNARKRPGDTFEDVIQRMLENSDSGYSSEQPAES